MAISGGDGGKFCRCFFEKRDSLVLEMISQRFLGNLRFTETVGFGVVVRGGIRFEFWGLLVIGFRFQNSVDQIVFFRLFFTVR